MARKYTNEEFIAKANNTHKGKYDYSKTNYVNIDILPRLKYVGFLDAIVVAL